MTKIQLMVSGFIWRSGIGLSHSEPAINNGIKIVFFVIVLKLLILIVKSVTTAQKSPA